MILIGLDIGTTHIKIGAFDQDGRLLYSAARPNRTQPGAYTGIRVYEPEELWDSTASLLRGVAEYLRGESVGTIGVASMAETGLLVDLAKGHPVTPLLPWFEMGAAVPQEALGRLGEPQEVLIHSGIYPTYKCALAKLLWLKDTQGQDLTGLTWLNAADYIVYRLTGEAVSDPSLAGRTGAFDLASDRWNYNLLERLGLPGNIFARIQPAGVPAGQTNPAQQAETGLMGGIPVAVCGHDHLCAAFGAGAIRTGDLFDSLGTAESLVGSFPLRPLTQTDVAAGLSYGKHVIPGLMYWMGGLSTSGGALDWLRSVLGEPGLTYAEMDDLLNGRPAQPCEVIFLPYLAGSGSPHTDPQMRGSFLGLSLATSRTDLAQAVLEGAAFEIELIRRAGEQASGQFFQRVMAAGGGVRVPGWVQIKADVTGCVYQLASQPETTLAGAALAAGLGSGLYLSIPDIWDRVLPPAGDVCRPDPDRHARYQQRYSEVFLPVQEAVRSLIRS